MKIGSDLMKNKLVIWIAAGFVIIIAEVGVSYLLVSKVLMPSNTEVTVDSTGTANAEAVGQVGAETKQTNKKPPKKKADKKKKVKSDPMSFDPEGLFTLADFVVNPAGSRGKHFFVATMVFAFEDKAMVSLIQERDPVLKDMIITKLSKRPFTWYTESDNMEILKKDVVSIAEEVLGISGGIQVYLTKCVLQ